AGGLLGCRLLGGLLGDLLLGYLLGDLLLGDLLLGGLLRGLLGRALRGLLGCRLLGVLLGGLLLGGLLGDLLRHLLLGDLARGLLRGFLGRLLGDLLLCSFLRGHVMALLVSGLALLLLPSSSSARVSDPRTTAGARGAPDGFGRDNAIGGFAVPGMQKHLRPGASQVSVLKVVRFCSGDGACIHLVEVRGGGLMFAARFRRVLTHSFLCDRLLGET